MLKEEAIWEKEILLSSLLLVLRKFRKFSPKKAWPISASNFAILWTVLAWEHISFTKRWVHSKWLRNIWMKFPLSHSGDLKLRERVLGRMRLGFCQTQTNWETVKTQGRSWMLPSLPILAGQGFIIRAAQKSTASRVAKDRKAFVLNISTWPRFPRQILWMPASPLPVRVLQATWEAADPSSILSSWLLSRTLCFQAGLDVSRCEFPKERGQLLKSVLESQRGLKGETVTKHFPSLTYTFFGLQSLTFVTFPHFSAFHGFLCL